MALVACPDERPLRILIVEDSEEDALLMLHRFREAGYEACFQRVCNALTMHAALKAQSWDVVLCDHSMPGFDSFTALREMQEMRRDLPFIVVSGHMDEEMAVEVMRAGAHDYLSKDNLERLVPAVERELREARHRMERRAALEAVRESESRFRALAANIPGMVFQAMQKEDGGLKFLYVSEGSLALLQLQREELLAAPDRFMAMMLEEDRPGFVDSLTQATEKFSTLNWEGRIIVPGGDMKWINLRGSPRRMESGDVLLWEGIVSNITHGKEAEKAIRESRQQLAELSSHMETMIEQERARIARDIHDELGGLLVAMKFEVSLLAGKIAKEIPTLAQRIISLGKLVDDAIGTAGRVAQELRPGILAEFGLAAAIESQALDFSQRTGISCHVLCADHDIKTEQNLEVALFRIFQEALTNISKHAHASRVDVRLLSEGDDVVLEICDDGRGLKPNDLKKPKSFGLRGIRERMQNLGGSLDILTGAKGGTHLVLRVPLPCNGMGVEKKEP
jgi:PAS domain S-box-containing protein